MRFSDIPGHDEVKEQLIRAVARERVAHAYLFHGQEGSAALPLAMAFAQYLQCADRGEEDACGVCPACQKAEKMIHPDIIFSFPGVTTKNIKAREVRSDLFMEQWREAVKKNPYLGLPQWYEALEVENKQGLIYTAESEEILRKMNLTPYEADRKVLIMWLPENLHPSAANPLLKIIEEPPASTIFLLVTTDPARVLPTIVSRCQAVPVPRMDDEGMRSWLAGHYGLAGEVLKRVVVMADGNMLQARQIVEQTEEEGSDQKKKTDFFDLFTRWMRLSYKPDIKGLVQWVDEVSQLGREQQKLFLSYVLHVLRENLMMNLFREQTEKVRLTEEEAAFSEKFSVYIHPGNMEDIYRLMGEAWDHIAGNAYNKLVFMDVSLKLNKLLKK